MSPPLDSKLQVQGQYVWLPPTLSVSEYSIYSANKTQMKKQQDYVLRMRSPAGDVAKL